jgi:predicted membrane-bound spermidine synthase
VRILYLLFFLSGFAALLDQVVWQRTLFAIYGINIESVTMVVTAFMLGLGLGSLAGGEISKDPRRPTVLLFAIVELLIGLFGASSLTLFRGIGSLTLLMSPLAIGVVTFFLVLLPTMLMGGTLPLLVAHFSRQSKNVGRAVGMLYFINTLGSAFASIAAVVFLLGRFGQTNTVRVASLLNFTAALTALAIWHLSRKEPLLPAAPAVSEPEPVAEPDVSAPPATDAASS